ncbi:MAG: hypothetical protein ACI36V_02285 [Coriobacteriales bacterium]
MTRTKKIIAGLCTAALAAVTALGLAGCGEDVAASWSHGKVLEADVTAAAEAELKYYVEDDGSYDISSWTNYIANREYIEDATEEEQKAYEEAADGTAADYREYLAKQKVREAVIAYEVDKRNIEVTDEEIEEQLQFEAQIYESYYGGGHAGTFESILHNYFGMTLEEYKEGVAKQLKEDKLKEQVIAEKKGDSTEQPAEGDDAAAEEVSEEEEADNDALFNEYIESLMESYNVKVTECPANLSYDPQTLAASAEAASAGTDAAAEGDDAASEDDAAKEE